jgi:hypothetical protein
MKRFMTVVAVLSTLALASTAVAGEFGWTVSSSSTDAFAHIGSPAGTPQLITLYLWIACDTGVTGAAASEFGLSSTGVITVSGVVGSQPQFLFTGSVTDLLGAFGGGPGGGTMVGIVTAFDQGTGGGVCFVPSASNGRNITVGVDGNGYDNDYIGYDSAGGVPCESPAFCDVPVSVESGSWGSIKSLYR